METFIFISLLVSCTCFTTCLMWFLVLLKTTHIYLFSVLEVKHSVSFTRLKLRCCQGYTLLPFSVSSAAFLASLGSCPPSPPISKARSADQQSPCFILISLSPLPVYLKSPYKNSVIAFRDHPNNPG